MKGKWLNIILFILTLISTTVAGAFMSGEVEINNTMLFKGLSFSISLLFILGTHEIAHYYASLIHNVEATLPYFIPFPSMIGTFGAFIKIKSGIGDKRSLFDIGISGPIASFICSIPIFVIGLTLSKYSQTPSSVEGIIQLGDSIIVFGLTKLIHPNIATNVDLILHPMAFAGWIGFWVTSINLLPIGQLDGGHISYAVFGDKHKIVSRIMFFILLPLGVLWIGWLVWALVIFLFIKLDHPPTYNAFTSIDKKRQILAYFALLIFILTFTPTPFK